MDNNHTAHTPYGSINGDTGPQNNTSAAYSNHESVPQWTNIIGTENSMDRSDDVPCQIKEEETSQSLEKEDSEASQQGSGGFYRNLSTRQVLTLVMLCCAKTSGSMYGALLAPFFATEATGKGVSSTMIGLIFGSYPLIVFITSPFFGKYMPQIGSKFMFITGGIVCSCCGVLFGVLQWSPGGTVFIVLCFATRSVEAAATAAGSTAASALAACTFPSQISTVMGFLQASSCLGLVVGPPIGGLLADAGGYFLPFAVTGGIFFVANIISIFVLPSIDDEPRQNTGRTQKATNWNLVKIPAVLVVGYLSMVGQAAIGFIDVALATYIAEIRRNSSKPALSSAYIGLIFLIPAGIAVLLSPIYGWLADKKPVLSRPFMLLGATLAATGFFVMGPSPLLSFLKPSVTLVIISLAWSAIGWGALVVTYQEFVVAARKRGFPEGLATQGIISGINNSFNNLGAFFGPTIGGVMLDHLHFPWSASVIAGFQALAVILLVVLLVGENCCGGRNAHEVSTPDGRERLINNIPQRE